jgi:hypothetical protein
VALREAALERCYALKAAHKAGRHRGGRLGGAPKHDGELRKWAAALDGHLRAHGGSLSSGSLSGSSSKLSLGLVGDSAWLAPHEAGLAASVAAQVGSGRLRAVVLRHAGHYDAARALLGGGGEAAGGGGGVRGLELNDPGAVAFCALDDLAAWPGDGARVTDLKVCGSRGDGGRGEDDDAVCESSEVSNGKGDAIGDIGSGDDAELAAAAFEGQLDGEPLLGLPLPPIGLSAAELRVRFNWRGHAANHLRFPSAPAGVPAAASEPDRAERSSDGASGGGNDSRATAISLRRALWLPLLGAASVFDTLDDALRCRAAWRATGGPGVLGPLLCRDGARVDEFGFAHGASAVLPESTGGAAAGAAGAAGAAEGEEAAGGGGARPSANSRALWLSEPPLEACKEFRSLKALEAALAMHSAQVESKHRLSHLHTSHFELHCKPFLFLLPICACIIFSVGRSKRLLPGVLRQGKATFKAPTARHLCDGFGSSGSRRRRWPR